ncbi:MAG: D-alanine--D-alanine ligase family protein [Chlamydiota bacterium]
MKKKIAILFGGRSVEHEISVITALQMMEAIDLQKYDIIPVYIDLEGRWMTGKPLTDKAFYKSYAQNADKLVEVTLLPKPGLKGLTVLKDQRTIPVDLYFLCFHGQYGEDGCIQGLLELADAAYTGCGHLVSALSMHKAHTKSIMKNAGIPVLPGAVVRRRTAQKDIDKTIDSLDLGGFPLIIKPLHLGSSIGVSRANNRHEVYQALARAFKYDTEVLIEPCLTNMLEINASVLEGEEPLVSVVEIPVASQEFLTYDDKYLRGSKSKSGEQQSEGLAGLVRDIDPQSLDPKLKKQVQDYALQAYGLLECGGVVRFDFYFDCNSDQLYFNEVNPLPGSLSYYLWEKSQPRLLYTELIDSIINAAEKHHGDKHDVCRDFGFKALVEGC